jgi:hypothetical protein
MVRYCCCRVAALLAATLCLVVVHDGRWAATVRPLKQAVEERTEAVLDVAAAEAPEGVRWAGGGEAVLGAGKWLPMPMFPAASGLLFPPVSPFPGAGASMPWLPAFTAPGGMPYVGATRNEQLSLWASLLHPMQVGPRLAVGTLGPAGGETTGGQVDRGSPAIASGGKAVQLGVPKWGVFLGNIDHRY